MRVEIDFNAVDLQDDQEDGILDGEVRLIYYKGNHYHLVIGTDDNELVYADTNDVWDDGDLVGINFIPSGMRIYPKEQ